MQNTKDYDTHFNTRQQLYSSQMSIGKCYSDHVLAF